jgi:hypothetical protein
MVMLREVVGGDVICDVLAREVAGELYREQGHVVGMLEPEPEKKRVADDLHARFPDFLCRKLLLRPIRGRDQEESAPAHALFHLESVALTRVVRMDGRVRFDRCWHGTLADGRTISKHLLTLV